MVQVHLALGAADEAHVLLLDLVARVTGCEAAALRLGHACPRCGSGEHGRPVVLGVSGRPTAPQVSLARDASGTVAVLAVCERPVGVDVEAPDAATFGGAAELVLHPDEAGEDPSRMWVRKEAWLKALGTGLATDPSSIALPQPDDGRGSSPLSEVLVDGWLVCVAVPSEGVELVWA